MRKLQWTIEQTGYHSNVFVKLLHLKERPRMVKKKKEKEKERNRIGTNICTRHSRAEMAARKLVGKKKAQNDSRTLLIGESVRLFREFHPLWRISRQTRCFIVLSKVATCGKNRIRFKEITSIKYALSSF